jgi:hypothetical protein
MRKCKGDADRCGARHPALGGRRRAMWAELPQCPSVPCPHSPVPGPADSEYQQGFGNQLRRTLRVQRGEGVLKIIAITAQLLAPAPPGAGNILPFEAISIRHRCRPRFTVPGWIFRSRIPPPIVFLSRRKTDVVHSVQALPDVLK